MKRIGIFIVVAALAWFAVVFLSERGVIDLSKLTGDKSQPAESVAPSPEPLKESTTQEPPAVVAESQPTPTPKLSAPSGICYLVRDQSVKTDAGIIGILQGTQVKLITSGSAGEIVEVNGHRLTVPAGDLTDDLRVLQRIEGTKKQITAASTSAPAISSSSQYAEQARRKQEQAGQLQQDYDRRQREAKRQQIQVQIDRLNREISALESQAGDMRNKANTARIYGKHSSYDGEASARERRASELRTTVSQLQMQLVGN